MGLVVGSYRVRQKWRDCSLASKDYILPFEIHACTHQAIQMMVYLPARIVGHSVDWRWVAWNTIPCPSPSGLPASAAGWTKRVMPRGLPQKMAVQQRPNHEIVQKMSVARQLPRCTTQRWLDGGGSWLHQEQRLSHQERLERKRKEGRKSGWSQRTAACLCLLTLI